MLSPRIMLRMGLGLRRRADADPAVLRASKRHLCQLLINHPKMAAIEGRWNDEKPGSEVLFAWPDAKNRRNLFAITLPPPFGSLIEFR